MRESFTQAMEPLATGLELFGVAVIAISVAFATINFLRQLRREAGKAAYDSYRANLGRGILLGLELLVGADIIATVTAPLTWESVGLLGLIVLIRTFLSFSLETEIEGQWPWQRRRGQEQEKSAR
ncbi:Uncharacterized membrane protein [Novosphingobium sp. CF614]|uniref:DUF1622 domain-containing protein n=1 Tax=Novosphingobium sp. CF614 TaxID=1884364 RepID=UPI0008EBDF8C|nr:DUF1622 domain-containing protein [Novosphingobium sp. CF614]SFG49408.1 Uncharacterized membrane protein [Novosphingobium sp. CF614]